MNNESQFHHRYIPPSTLYKYSVHKSNYTISLFLFAGSGVLGGWWFGGGPSSPDSNYLRVANAAFPNRRLSDNTLMTPKIRIAPSCASSPGINRTKTFNSPNCFQFICISYFVCCLGGTPGGGLPIRRHSSIGPQERRASAMNLSPPTVSI